MYLSSMISRKLEEALALAVMLLSALSDFVWVEASPTPDSSLPWYAVAVITILALSWAVVVLITKPKRNDNLYFSPEVDESILCRWDAVCNKYKIDPEEMRSQIWNFPTELNLIVELEHMRLASNDRPLRKRLGTRIHAIMNEALAPLAAELDYLAASNRVANKLVREADKELLEARRATNTAYAEFLLGVS